MRLDDPHPDSFLYFAARLREDEDLYQVNPDLLIARHRFTARGAEVVGRIALENFQHRTVIYTDSYLEGARLHDPALNIDSPAVRFLAETCGSYAAILVEPQAKLTPEVRQGADGWRPRWQTVDGIVMGAWLAAGAGSCTRAAGLLNTKRPHRLEGVVGRCAVHRSLEREISRIAFARFPFDGGEISRWSALAFIRISEMRSALAVWRKLHASKGRNAVGAYWKALRLDGRLFEMEAAVSTDDLDPNGTLRQEVEASAWVIHGRVLARLQKAVAERRLIEMRSKMAGAPSASPR